MGNKAIIYENKKKGIRRASSPSLVIILPKRLMDVGALGIFVGLSWIIAPLLNE